MRPCPGSSGASKAPPPAKPRSTPVTSDTDTKPKKKKMNVRFDPFINSKSVFGLDHNIIEEFLEEKDACLVMFYHPEEKPLSDWAKPHFIRAAKTTERKNHAFAAVNCQKEEEMCKDMDAEGPYPFYRLFSRGFEIDSYYDVKKFLYYNMKRYVENAPVLNPKDVEPQRYRPCDFAQNIFCKAK